MHGILVAPVLSLCVGCVLLGDPTGYTEFGGELIIPISSETGGLGFGAGYRRMPLEKYVSPSTLWGGWCLALRSVPREGDDIFSFGGCLAAEWYELAGLPLAFRFELGVGLNAADGETAFGHLTGVGLRICIPCDRTAILITMTYVDESFWGDSGLPFKEQSYVSVMVTCELGE